jgi:DMSO/TMAO reductase YedYZ molybdopterin-dependent catalytic subunit
MTDGVGADGLVLLSDSPRNGQTRLAALRAPITPTAGFYIRSNFPTPEIDPAAWRLELDVGGPRRRIDLAALQAAAPHVTRTVTLECAGNGRTLMRPQPEGTPWTLGATGTATFTGIPLEALLPDDLGDAVEIVFRGADRGERPGWGEVVFERSLPVDVLADAPAPFVAWSMNGAPLTADHGGPVRLVVPGWYAVASVKWLSRIALSSIPFEGYFQTDRYRYVEVDGSVAPVRRMRVRALLLAVGGVALEAAGPAPADPEDVLEVSSGSTRLAGIAWSGHGEVASVAVSLDGGASWREAEVEAGAAPFARTAWHLDADLAPGAHEVVVRAADASGRIQPLEPVRNALGYGNNVAHRVRLEAR